VKTYLTQIEKTLVEELNRYKDSFFYKPLLYAVKGGKRIRPLILVLSAKCVSDKHENPYPAAVAVELLHTESLIHDDIIDKETFRRGKTPFHVRYGEPAAILSSDFTLAAVLDIITRHYENKQILREIVYSTLKMCEGEMMDVRIRSQGNTLNWETYLNLVDKKTASLFFTAARIGAIIGGGKDFEIKALSSFGRFLGISYQIKDDLLDFEKGEKALEFLETLTGKSVDEKFLIKLKKFVKDYSRMAIESLKPLKESKAKKHLCNLAKFSVLRKF